MKKIKVWFLDWYMDSSLPGSSMDNIYLRLLENNYDVTLDKDEPDVLFYSLGYNDHLKYQNCIKIFVCDEPGFWSPELLNTYDPGDRARVSLEDDPKYFRFPYFITVLYHHIKVTKILDSFETLTKYKNYTLEDIKNKKFCIFLQLNETPTKRRDLFIKLNEYKKVDSNSYNKNISIASYYDNFGGSLGKINFIKDYKFSFAMQNHYAKDINSSYKIPGFIDEKLIESFIGNTLPLYYGNDKITDIFNKDSFINWHEFEDDDKFIEKVLEVNNND